METGSSQLRAGELLTPLKVSRVDKQPSLPRDDAEALLRKALGQYRSEHRHLLARVVVHKTSRFAETEIEGF